MGLLWRFSFSLSLISTKGNSTPCRVSPISRTHTRFAHAALPWVRIDRIGRSSFVLVCLFTFLSYLASFRPTVPGAFVFAFSIPFVCPSKGEGEIEGPRDDGLLCVRPMCAWRLASIFLLTTFAEMT